jgi:trans-2,3-dihydro-3-hydroxyanthranilate isomerase
MRRRFVTLDVFTSQRFAGNPLAVVLDAEGLADATLQAVAREFNLAETVFVFPPSLAGHRARLRIFTPLSELPFAGHPTVGTAALLARLDGGSQAREFLLEEGVGPVHCRVEPIDEEHADARFQLPGPPTELGAVAAPERLAAALGLSRMDIGCEDFVPARWTAGVPITFVPVRGLAQIRACRADLGHWDAIEPPGAAFVFCRESTDPGHAFHARMFAPPLGVPEDPATGSAAAAFAGVLSRFARLGDGEHAYVIEQGYEMGRPSLIRLFVTMRDRQLSRVAVGGQVVSVSQGTIEA